MQYRGMSYRDISLQVPVPYTYIYVGRFQSSHLPIVYQSHWWQQNYRHNFFKVSSTTGNLECVFVMQTIFFKMVNQYTVQALFYIHGWLSSRPMGEYIYIFTFISRRILLIETSLSHRAKRGPKFRDIAQHFGKWLPMKLKKIHMFWSTIEGFTLKTTDHKPSRLSEHAVLTCPRADLYVFQWAQRAPYISWMLVIR